ncbi:MAG: TIGR03936 family radical SAM-associated protein [Veillonellaceae bacterium]|nr:TIGR03936 family radical SAM-associated protein [Veillonellaceae bacterium]
MTRLRMALHKGEELRYLSHLDYAQAVARMIRRSGLSMVYSEGFNPHMKISFSSALALGITAEAEYVDMDVLADVTVEEVKTLLLPVAPKGLEPLDGVILPDKVKKMMAICNYAIYEVRGSLANSIKGQVVDWIKALQSFNEAQTIEYEKVTPKKTRIIDVKHFVKDAIEAKQEGDEVVLTMGIGIYHEGTIKPGEVWNLGRTQFGWPISDGYVTHRKAILVEGEDGFRYSPLDSCVF